jgi:DNA-binding response OmpR family regulator
VSAAIAKRHMWSGTVLLLEDDALVARSLARLLRAQGHMVLTCHRADDALRVCRSYGGVVDLLIADVNLPDDSGPHVAAQLAALQPTMATLFISGCDREELLADGRLAADASFLQKPFGATHLASALQTLLHK